MKFWAFCTINILLLCQWKADHFKGSRENSFSSNVLGCSAVIIEMQADVQQGIPSHCFHSCHLPLHPSLYPERHWQIYVGRWTTGLICVCGEKKYIFGLSMILIELKMGKHDYWCWQSIGTATCTWGQGRGEDESLSRHPPLCQFKMIIKPQH